MAPPRPKIGKSQALQLAQPLDFGPKLGLGAGIKHVECKSTLSLHGLPRAKFIENGQRRDFPHCRVRPRAVEMQLVLTIDLPKLVFGEPEVGEPTDEVRRKHLGLAVEGITGQPYELFLAKSDRAGVIELSAKLSLIDHLGKPDMSAAINDGKGHAPFRVEFPDHSTHQQLEET